MEEREGEVSESCHHRRAVTEMDEYAILAEGDVLDVVEAVLDLPVAALEFEQALGVCDLFWQTGDAKADLLPGLALLPPGSLDREDLSQIGPVAVADQVA